MSTTALFLVLSAAVSHAIWNLLARTSSDRMVLAAGMSTVGALAVLPAAIYLSILNPPDLSAWPWAAVTNLLNLAYFFSLVVTYQSADLSLSYPLMRGTAVMLTAAIGIFVLGERIPPLAWIGMCLVPIGMFIAFSRGGGSKPTLARLATSPSTILAPMMTGLVVAMVTVWDKLAVIHFQPLIYQFLALAGTAVSLLTIMFMRRGFALLSMFRLEWRRIVACGLLNGFSYVFILYALTQSPVTYVAAARETSVVFGALLGAILLKEPQGTRRVVGAVLIFSGVVVVAMLR